MTEQAPPLRFETPGSETLQLAEQRAATYFQPKYSRHASERVADEIRAAYDMATDEDPPRPAFLAIQDWVELFPKGSHAAGVAFETYDELEHILTDGRATLRFTAYHDDLDPHSIDIEKVGTGLAALDMRMTDLRTREEFEQYWFEWERVWNSEAGMGDDPVSLYTEDVDLALEDPQYALSTLETIQETVKRDHRFSIEGYNISLLQDGTSAEQIDAGLRARADGLEMRTNHIELFARYQPDDETERVEDPITNTTQQRHPEEREVSLGIGNYGYLAEDRIGAFPYMMQHGRDDPFDGLYELEAALEDKGLDPYIPAIETTPT